MDKDYQLRERSSVVKSLATEMGFAFTGISKAKRLDEEAEKLEQWLNRGMHGKMGYMENYFEKRVDPSKLVPGAQTVVSLMYNYYTEKEQTDPESPKVSKYAYGKDYHRVVKDKLFSLVKQIEDALGVSIEGRCFVDSAPVMERDWAKRSGIGWTGKNTLLIHPKAGSYFFLAELIIDLPLAADEPMKDYCGTCRKCIDACPTDAIDEEGYLLDARKCISYLTIELKDAIPPSFKGQMKNWMFGCDICQEVCPWNRFSKPHDEEDFEPHSELLDMTKGDWEELTEEVFRKVFKKSAVKRAKFEGLKRNIKFLSKN